MQSVYWLCAALIVTTAPLRADSSSSDSKPKYEQAYVAKNYDHLIGMPGFTEDSLKKHFTLYQGYVKNTNLLLSLLSEMDAEEKQSTPCWAEIHRRLGWEWDGMRLHEYYFDNLGGKDKLNEKSALNQALVAQYGSYDAWLKDFKAVGALRGIGWVVLYQDPRSGKLINSWIKEHPDGHLAGATPLLVMDVWEHAYMWDYGLDRSAYIDAFVKNIHWAVVDDRYRAANSEG